MAGRGGSAMWALPITIQLPLFRSSCASERFTSHCTSCTQPANPSAAASSLFHLRPPTPTLRPAGHPAMTSSAAAAPPQEAPGADFLRRRLARAEAVPVAERSCEVQACLDGVALLRQVRGWDGGGPDARLRLSCSEL